MGVSMRDIEQTETRLYDVTRVEGATQRTFVDQVAVEEPLEILVKPVGEPPVVVAVTMRTPGNDLELTAGFLWAEGILTSQDQIDSNRSYVVRVNNQACIALTSGSATVTLPALRPFQLTSACGVCGKQSIESISTVSQFGISSSTPKIDAELIHSMSSQVRISQNTFALTGGLHAASLFSATGELIDVREDIGRHNAVDKLIGAQIVKGNLPLSNYLLFLSGRSSFELVQKASMAGIPIVAGVGAPSSLAVELAQSRGITLLGFVRDNRFNIYTAADRITDIHDASRPASTTKR
jgi:FdhD protein